MRMYFNGDVLEYENDPLESLARRKRKASTDNTNTDTTQEKKAKIIPADTHVNKHIT